MTEDSFRLLLTDTAPAVVNAFHVAFHDAPHVEIHPVPFEALPEFDCMVSPANSFGLMDGGVDAAIIAYFGTGLMRRVQEHILQRYLGEQPVGTSFLVETGHSAHPYLAHTPTMRVPMPIAGTDNVYLAMWAMLLAVREHNRQASRPIRTVACPGLGTGTGMVPPQEAARQMRLACTHFLNPPRSLNWNVATQRQDAVRYGGTPAAFALRRHLTP